MKVGTDGVLLGAWTECKNYKSILDIGTGTGLIALMLAQKSNANITAIEKNIEAYNQAVENVSNSNWNNRISVIFDDFLDYVKKSSEIFDLIVSNPPFFVSSLKNPDKNKTEARHNENLPYDKLIEGISYLSHIETVFNIIIPIEQEKRIYQISEFYKFYCNRITYVKPNINKEAKRILISFSKEKKEIVRSSITIETNQRHQYTQEYKELTKDFYLLF